MSYEIETEEVKKERLKFIKLILDPYVKTANEDKCGELFDKLYDKSLTELSIYYTVFNKK